jgi:hypothetical protein
MNITANAENVTNSLDVSGGNGNQFTMTLNSSKATNDIKTVGATNTFTVEQTGVAGTSGHYLKVDSNGSSNIFDIKQGGTIDTTVNIKSVGNSNNFTINTRN